MTVPRCRSTPPLATKRFPGACIRSPGSELPCGPGIVGGRSGFFCAKRLNASRVSRRRHRDHVEMISNGQTKKAKVVLAIAVVEGVSWLLGLDFDSPSGIFWGIENPPADWWT